MNSVHVAAPTTTGYRIAARTATAAPKGPEFHFENGGNDLVVGWFREISFHGHPINHKPESEQLRELRSMQ